MTEVTEQTQEPVVEGADGVARQEATEATPAIVPAQGAGPAPGADIVGEVLAPNPGAQPGELSPHPIAANTADDPNANTGEKAPASTEVKPASADDPNPEASALGSTDPAVHNPRPPLDAANPDPALNDARAEFDEPAEDEGGPVDEDGHPVNFNALRGIPTGPEHTRHGQHIRRNAPLRRDEV